MPSQVQRRLQPISASPGPRSPVKTKLPVWVVPEEAVPHRPALLRLGRAEAHHGKEGEAWRQPARALSTADSVELGKGPPTYQRAALRHGGKAHHAARSPARKGGHRTCPRVAGAAGWDHWLEVVAAAAAISPLEHGVLPCHIATLYARVVGTQPEPGPPVGRRGRHSDGGNGDTRMLSAIVEHAKVLQPHSAP